MSFEGFYQRLCENRHHYTVGLFFEETQCPECGSHYILWENLVDTTNGSWDINDERIDDYVELEVDDPAEFNTCDLGYKHKIKAAAYKVPQK